MINQSTFNKAVREFYRLEKRADFFALASNLVKSGFEIEAYILLLATWNFARFRYAVKDFDLRTLKRTCDNLKKYYERLQHQSIESIDLNAHKKSIVKVFDTLAAIRGIEFTGASKLMHLKNPALFVMWDDFIRGEKPRKYYNDLDLTKSGQWPHFRYAKSGEGYVRFLKDMQSRFGQLSSPSQSKTLAKAIDEFNYVCITVPIQKMMNG
jgi:hypothetical protein